MGISGVSGISPVSAVDSVSAQKASGSTQVDSVSKSIQDKISAAQRQRREISSNEELSADEKMGKRKELQKEISSLNNKLRQRQAELRKEQQRKELTKEMRTDAVSAKGAKDKNTSVKDTDKSKNSDNKDAGIRDAKTGDAAVRTAGDSKTVDKSDKAKDSVKDTGIKADGKEPQTKPSGISDKDMRTMGRLEAAMKQARRPGAVIARMEEGIVILKGEIKLDRTRGADVTKKLEELAKQQKRAQRASSRTYLPKGATGKAKESSQNKTAGAGDRIGTAASVEASADKVISATNYAK